MNKKSKFTIKIKPEAEMMFKRIRENVLLIYGVLLGIVGNLVANIIEAYVTKRNSYPFWYVLLVFILFLLIVFLSLKEHFSWKLKIFKLKRSLNRIKKSTLILTVLFLLIACSQNSDDTNKTQNKDTKEEIKTPQELVEWCNSLCLNAKTYFDNSVVINYSVVNFNVANDSYCSCFNEKHFLVDNISRQNWIDVHNRTTSIAFNQSLFCENSISNFYNSKSNYERMKKSYAEVGVSVSDEGLKRFNAMHESFLIMKNNYGVFDCKDDYEEAKDALNYISEETKYFDDEERRFFATGRVEYQTITVYSSD